MWWLTGAATLCGLLLGVVLNGIAMRWDSRLTTLSTQERSHNPAMAIPAAQMTIRVSVRPPSTDTTHRPNGMVEWLAPHPHIADTASTRLWQYPLGAAAAAVVYAVSVATVGMRWELLLLLWCVSILYVIVQTDLAERIIPDRVVLAGAAGLLAMRLWIRPLPLWDYLVASLIGSGALLLIGMVGQRLLGRETMGGGDIKLYVFIGLMLGWKLTLLSLFAASLIGLLVTMLLRLAGRGAYGELVPFGPYIAVGAWAVYLWGEGWLGAYLTWVQGLVATG
ncbi:prepilin peptidase [Paenibacillus sp. 598K]|uniref:prepilin peptidase n=1 Tax=Paenibacillus sp. 598K TaxID=1117987 RepID=UPI000FF995EA|nr:A24 family peptidase [Paenibacillus sp. 598K]GBF73378.1 prepilin peptidase [Paenibacillus sp. 598K]